MYDTAVQDLREAVAVGAAENPFELARANANLGSVLLDLGDIAGAIDVGRQGFALCERMGTAEGFGRFLLGNLTEALFFAGEWAEAEQLAIAGLEHAGRTGGQYHEPLFMFVLAELGLTRDGRDDHARVAARRMIELARARGDDQVMLPVCSCPAWLLARTGREAEAETLLDELLALRRENPKGLMPGYWLTVTALTLERVGRSGALAALDEAEGSRFLEAGLAIDERRFADAARTLEEIRAPQLEAEVRILAARNGRGADHCARAEELFASLGASARLRRLATTRSA